jgi:putative chitinase
LTIEINKQNLRKAFPQALMEYIEALYEQIPILEKAGITENEKRFRHFLAQGAAETGGFTIKEESGKYTAEGLRRTFPKYFKSVSEARPYAGKPEAIFNRVYGGRLGNNKTGDGYKYRGRGIFQLTGKDSYKRYGERLGIDLAGNPDLACDPLVSVQIAAAYWTDLGLNAWADQDNLLAISRGINGGSPTRNIQPNGMNHRKSWNEKLKGAFSFGAEASERPAPEPVIEQPAGLREGDTGEKVESLQARLRAKGYPVGAIDKIFGANTRRGVTLFQIEMGLPEHDGVWRLEYDALLEAAPNLAVERSETTAKDLADKGDQTVKKLTLLQRLLMFFGLGSLITGGAAEQAGNFPELVTQYKPAVEMFGPSIQWLAQNGWLVVGIAAIGGFFLARYAVNSIVKAYRHNDYQGPFKGAG